MAWWSPFPLKRYAESGQLISMWLQLRGCEAARDSISGPRATGPADGISAREGPAHSGDYVDFLYFCKGRLCVPFLLRVWRNGCRSRRIPEASLRDPRVTLAVLEEAVALLPPPVCRSGLGSTCRSGRTLGRRRAGKAPSHPGPLRRWVSRGLSTGVKEDGVNRVRIPCTRETWTFSIPQH